MIIKRLAHLVALCFLLAFLPLQARAVNLCNNAWMNTATTGTGTISLSTALAGYQSFGDCGITNGQVVRYRIFDGSAWEVGSGTYTTSGTTLTRSVAESSNADAALNLSGGASVIITPLTADLPSESTPTDGTVDEAAYLMTLEGGVLKRYLISDIEAALDLADLTGILGLSKGGTAANLTDPGGDRIMFWDDSAGQIDWLDLGPGVSISTTTLSGGRKLLTADTTLYVRTDGNDSNDGSADTSGSAFLTVQAAVNAAYRLDLGGYTLTIQIADGTYATTTSINITLDKPFVGGRVVIQGNVTTPTNVVLTTTTATVVYVTSGASVQLKSFKMVSTSGRLVSVYGAGSTVGISGLDFGATTDSHIAVYGQSTLGIEGNYTVSGGAGGAHWGITNGAMITGGGKTITISTTVTIGTWAIGSILGKFDVGGMTFTNKANVTGTRYWLGSNAVLNTGGGGASYLPGTVAGSTSTGGQYL